MELAPNSKSGLPPPMPGRVRRIAAGLIRVIHNMAVAEKIYGIVALLVVTTALLVVMSIQSVRLQTSYRALLATSATAAINVERVNGLIYAIVMDSRGIYMSSDRDKVKQYGDELLKRNRELTDVVARWEETVRADDAEQFSAFKKRISQFVEFRRELVRRAIQVSPAAAREWGDNEAIRALRVELNADLEALARIYSERARDASELGDQGKYASWYLFALGFCTLILAALNISVMKDYVLGPLAEITKATDAIAAGKIDGVIPYVTRTDEIGRLAHAVRNFREAVRRNFELEQLEIGTAKQRDAAIGDRDVFTDKYHATKWRLSAAINSMPQGLIMLDAQANILVINEQYRKMYGLPSSIKAGSSLEDILLHRVGNGLFTGNVHGYLKTVLERISKQQPSSDEIVLGDGRLISIQERPMNGGGWVAVHDDITEQRRNQRILERTERFLVTVLENVPQALFARDARSLRYTFVNRAAEKLLGLSRAQIIGKSVRDIFPVESADLIERKDRDVLEGNPESGVAVRTITTPNNGQRTVAVRRLRIAGEADESQVLLSMIEDRTDEAKIEIAAA
jgi:PAS domain S-box-containing protein